MDVAMPSFEAQQRIIEALLSNQGLQALVNTAAAELGNPLVVVDAGFHYLACSPAPVAHDGSRLAQLMHQECPFTSVVEPAPATSPADKPQALATDFATPLVRHNAALQAATMLQSIEVHGTTIAHVLLVAATKPLDAGDTALFSLACRTIGQELQKGTISSSGPAQIEAYFLRHLLEDEAPNPQAIQRRLALLDLEPLETLFVVVLQPLGQKLDAQHAQSLRSQLGTLLTGALSTTYEDSLVLLLSRSNLPLLPAYELNLLQRVALEGHVSVGISNSFSDICAIRRHYDQARTALSYGANFNGSQGFGPVYQYCNCVTMELLEYAGAHTDLFNYVHPVVWTLYNYDQAHASELVETLFAYLQNGMSTTRTAKALNLHKNTLLYRLGRIREITGNNLSSGEDTFLFHLSIHTLKYLGLVHLHSHNHPHA